MGTYKNKKNVVSGFAKVFIFSAFLFGFCNLYAQGPAASALTVEQCLKLAAEKQQSGDIREATNFLDAAAEKCWDTKNYPKAIEYYNQSIELNKTISNWHGISGINCNLGLIYFDMGRYEESYQHLRLTYNYHKEQNEKISVISALINMSVTLNKMKRYDESIKVLEEAVNVSRDLNDYRQMSSCYGMLSETYLKAGDPDKASDYFHMYKTVYDDISAESEKRHKTELTEATMKAQLAETEKELAEVRRRYADDELVEMSKELEGLDSVNRELLKSKTKAELMINVLQAKEEITVLHNRETEAKLRQEQVTRRILIAGLCTALFIVLISGFFWWQKKRDNRRLAQQNALINQQKTELSDYQIRLEELVVARTSKLMRALDQAQESDRLKSAFFANMSHEIRTPLNAILGFSQIFDNQNDSQKHKEKMLSIVKSSAEQLTNMVEDIVTLSEIDSGVVKIFPHEHNIHKLLGNVMIEANERLRSTGKEKIEIILDDQLPENMSHFLVDAKKISRMLMHLIDNAIKNTDRGYIRIGCEHVSQKEKILRFWVEDTGTGIDAENIESIFDRFWKQGDAYTQKFRGLGIGLSLCKEFVKLMNGQLSVTSHVGKGSTFSFTVNYQ